MSSPRSKTTTGERSCSITFHKLENEQQAALGKIWIIVVIVVLIAVLITRAKKNDGVRALLVASGVSDQNLVVDGGSTD